MRDIRDDLRQRLRGIKHERTKIQGWLRVLDVRQHTLEGLLADEEARFGAKQQLELFSDTRPLNQTKQLKGFLMTLLADGNEHHLSDLAEKAHQNGVLPSRTSARRLNMTLINLGRSGLAERSPSGSWRQAKSCEPT